MNVSLSHAWTRGTRSLSLKFLLLLLVAWEGEEMEGWREGRWRGGERGDGEGGVMEKEREGETENRR